MISEKIAFEQLREGTLDEETCKTFIDYYMSMKPIWIKNNLKLFRQAWRKDKIMTKYFIDKFIFKESGL